MPDDRLFHRTLGHSAKVNELTDFERGVWWMYRLTSDDFGVMRFAAVTLQGAADWLAAKPATQIQRALQRLANIGLLQTFEHQGRVYCYQHDWQTWQKITHPRQTQQPAPPADILAKCCVHTRWLFSHHPKGGRLKSWQDPATVGKKAGGHREESGSAPGVDPEETRPVGNGLWVMGNGCVSGSGDAPAPRPVVARSFGERKPTPPAEMSERRGAFYDWYLDTHQRLLGVSYVTTNPHKDRESIASLCDAYTDQEMRDAGLVWFAMNDDFAMSGTRTITKFASRASRCLEIAKDRLKKQGIA